MKKLALLLVCVAAGGAFAAVIAFFALAVGDRAVEQDAHPAAGTSSTITRSPTPGAEETHPASEDYRGFLYGRTTTVDGATYEGRLRWGGGEEAFWGDYFNGRKDENPWIGLVPPEPSAKRRGIKFFGIEFGKREPEIDPERPFMARFGDIARIEARDEDIRVTLKSGTVFDLDRFEADDLADGLRVWDGTRGVVDFHERQIRMIELLPTAPLDIVPYRLHGTVHTRQGGFTGFIQWNREKGVGSDGLDGRSAEGKLSLRFDTIRSITPRPPDSSLVTLLDGREIVLSDSRDVGRGHRGLYVDDRRYGRVLIQWNTVERVDFGPGGSGPAYGDFLPGHPITGSVTTRAGDVFTGRLVYDLDESETTETLDAPSGSVHYTIPFGLIASIAPSGDGEPRARPTRVTLHDGEELQLEPAGDLGEQNAGMLIFLDGRPDPEYLPWTDVEQISFDRPPDMYPPPAGG